MAKIRIYLIVAVVIAALGGAWLYTHDQAVKARAVAELHANELAARDSVLKVLDVEIARRESLVTLEHRRRIEENKKLEAKVQKIQRSADEQLRDIQVGMSAGHKAELDSVIAGYKNVIELKNQQIQNFIAIIGQDSTQLTEKDLQLNSYRGLVADLQTENDRIRKSLRPSTGSKILTTGLAVVAIVSTTIAIAK